MLIDKTNGKLDEIKAFAKEIGKLEQLQKELDYLADYSDKETRCSLFTDFAPQSFAFTMEVKDKEGEWKYWYNGGLIFHGSHDGFGSGVAPTFSVSISPTDGWQIHT